MRQGNPGATTRWRLLSFLALLLAFAMVVSACSSDSDEDTTDTTTTAAAGETPGTTADETPGTTATGSTEAAATDTTQPGGVCEDGEHLVWALAQTPDSLFAPTYFATPEGSGLMGLVYDNLLAITGEGDLVTSAAVSWEAVGPTTYVYTLREGMLFSDGTPVTPEDVKFSIDMQSDEAVASKGSFLFENVESVTVDGNDIVVELISADSTWKFIPAHMMTYIVSQADVEANLAAYGTPEHFPLGSGPYMVSEWVPDSHITMVRNPNYGGEAPIFDTLRFPVIPDEQTRLLAMQSAEIDGTFRIPSAALSQWEAIAGINTVPSFIIRGLTIDMDQEPFNDIHVRRALYYATNREGIVTGLFTNQAVPAKELNSPAMFEGVLSADEVAAAYAEIEDFPFDLDKAREELALSSVPDGFSLVINVPEGHGASDSITQSIKDTWGQIGVDVELNLMPGGPRFQLILDHGPDLGVQIIGNLPDVPDPLVLLQLYYASDQAAPGGNNSSNFRDDTIDAMLAEATQSSDPVEAARIGLEIQKLVSEQVPIIPILWSNQQWAYDANWTMDPANGFSNTHVFVEGLHPCG
jgi:peptide/nickel transport system substrate-binding protein